MALGLDLIAETELLREVIDTVDVGVFVANQRGEAVIYNSAMARLEGLEPRQVLGRHVLEIFPSLTKETSTILQVLRSGQPIIDRHQTYLNINGRKITTINTTVPILRDGQIVGALETSKDITWVKELSEKVLDLQRALLSRREANIETQPGMGARYNFADIIGDSQALQEAIRHAMMAARTSSTVLIYGETGTGKELFAQSIHTAGSRHNGPFIAQNCAAIPQSLLEGILFGTTKGSFTGALDRPGLFEQAHGGTLLLDELNSMSHDLQAKLLRVLQEGRVRRVGGSKEIPVDVRVIATTNQEPRQALSVGSLRQDLYYRLSVVTIHIPPLRVRADDQVLLVRHFIQEFNHQFGRTVTGLSPEVAKLFNRYHWPGNVRELRHCLEGAFNMAGVGDETLLLEHLPPHLRFPSQAVKMPHTPGLSLDEALGAYERQLITEQMVAHQGNITKAADALGVSRQSLQYKLRKHHI